MKACRDVATQVVCSLCGSVHVDLRSSWHAGKGATLPSERNVKRAIFLCAAHPFVHVLVSRMFSLRCLLKRGYACGIRVSHGGRAVFRDVCPVSVIVESCRTSLVSVNEVPVQIFWAVSVLVEQKCVPLAPLHPTKQTIKHSDYRANRLRMENVEARLRRGRQLLVSTTC